MDRVDLELGLEVMEIQPSHARWPDAVTLRENRAFSEVSVDSGLALEEVRQLYAAHAVVNGMGFHDSKLRTDAKSSGVLLFLRENEPLAYAVAHVGDLAKTGVNIGTISDVCFTAGLTDLDCEAVFQALLSWAAAHGAEKVNITADGSKADLLEGIGGGLVRATWQFPNPDSTIRR